MKTFMENHDYRVARENMVARQIRARGIKDPLVLKAMSTVPRHVFVDEALQMQSYNDHPLPIGEKQTISQPYTVALMTEVLHVVPGDVVLEIGSGCGYQTAILAELAAKVYSVERIPSLAARAKKCLARLGYVNALIRVGDGTKGWIDYAPYDRIIVTAGAPDVPKPLLDQLTDGGLLVIPVGGQDSQELLKVERSGNAFRKSKMGGCRFVDLIGDHGWTVQERSG